MYRQALSSWPCTTKRKTCPAMAPVVAKGGLKLKPVGPKRIIRHQPQRWARADPDGEEVIDGGPGRRYSAQLREGPLGEMVVDKTGIECVYDFELQFTSDDVNANATDADSIPSLFTALKEIMGLRLQPEKVCVDIIVVDHAERVPTDN
ncbi:MAG TPA: TIGR03435 family protein [Bryobacteraceae bacterium]|nr:TIGR03435 family protein [Bryobacteraceae bacterium]